MRLKERCQIDPKSVWGPFWSLRINLILKWNQRTVYLFDAPRLLFYFILKLLIQFILLDVWENLVSIVSGKPSMATINSSPEGLYRNSYNLTWSIKSSSPLEKVRILFRKMVRARIILRLKWVRIVYKGFFCITYFLFFCKL